MVCGLNFVVRLVLKVWGGTQVGMLRASQRSKEECTQTQSMYKKPRRHGSGYIYTHTHIHIYIYIYIMYIHIEIDIPRGSKVVPFWAVYYNPEKENRS